MMTKEELFEEIKLLLVNKFEIEESRIQLDTTFIEDLDLDSIDIVDLIIELNERLGNVVQSGNDFVGVRTIGDITDKLLEIINRNSK